uniref:Uncharacterized protein n=1 Tax=Candidatus Kentrum sp. FM TaxID=2126340 RepID=A0A450U0M7_9GAMM|nr:MAG: hypothetical protein BECKFM1743C_GA0114222_108682 [Candidatus Kentron sp. FM]VFJ75857.1 MAG: hypothetical protein BECKFM1743A_GA0114220_108812 [Candidatus Kentron sp. FM]VFK22589.1 MAG: hypothetical protein BECKFM1743B_GA0114221_108702 [Candidatus Kentron sp. FM]
MIRESERRVIRKEIEGVLNSYGVQSPDISTIDLTPEQFTQLRQLAMGVVRGSIPINEISKLPAELSAQLTTMIRNIISLRDRSTLQEIQERNPYYDVFSSPIVRDGNNNEKE